MVGFLALPLLVVEAELRRRPELTSLPGVVQVRGRVHGLSPSAEQAGPRVGQPASQAQVLCPQVMLLPYDGSLCLSAWERVLAQCAQFVPSLEPASSGELFFSLPPANGSGVLAEMAGAVADGLGLTCHGGAGVSKLVAKLAAQVRPGALVAEGEEARFLSPLPVERLWLLEAKVIAQLQSLGLSTIGLLQQAPEALLARHFGAQARALRELAFGRDHSPVRPLYPPLTVQARVALPEPAEDAAAAEALLRSLTSQVAAQLADRHQTCRRVALRVETEAGRCTRQCLLTHPCADAAELLLAAHRLLAKAGPLGAISALALRVSELARQEAVQFTLLPERAEGREARACLARAIELVRRQFGQQSARWARECEQPRRERMLACWRGEQG